MTSTNRLAILLFSSFTVLARPFTAIESFNTLLDSNGPIHATIHLNNIIKNGMHNLTQVQLDQLNRIGLYVNGNTIDVENTELDQIYETEHFRFYYTLEGYDKVQDQEYVNKMGDIFEEVWSFYIDSMLFDIPSVSINNLYEVRIENLPADYFGYAVALGYGNSCDSYIKMRNSYSAFQFSSNSEEDNIKVTAVHEFFHSIQFDYNCHAFEQSPWFMEATAVWSEDELYDDINDLYRYMASWFSSPNRSITFANQWHEYGSFIFFQYIDEHMGGQQTIRRCWEKSREKVNAFEDVTFASIDEALEPFGSSFEDAYKRMCIANRILSDSENADLYRYQEASGYATVVNGPSEDYIIFNENDTETIYNQSLELYESKYYSVIAESPVRIRLSTVEGKFSLIAIIKQIGLENWTIRFGDDINIDPNLGIEWISVLVSAIGESESFWNYTLQLTDGYSEDVTSFDPYPNPSHGDAVFFPLQLLGPQTIYLTVFDNLGRKLWKSSEIYKEETLTTLSWSGTNLNGRQVANGIYYVVLSSNKYKKVHKVTYLKKK